MNDEALRELYTSSEVAKAFFDHMASRQRRQSETRVHRILEVLNRDGFDFSRRDIVDLFKSLQEIGCGRFYPGRHSWPSRHVWGEVNSLAVARLAIGEEDETELLEDGGEAEDMYEDEGSLLTHTFNLRSDLAIKIHLPSDLSVNEAERLSLFVKSLPMEDFA